MAPILFNDTNDMERVMRHAQPMLGKKLESESESWIRLGEGF